MIYTDKDETQKWFLVFQRLNGRKSSIVYNGFNQLFRVAKHARHDEFQKEVSVHGCLG
jgi:hypothetical protein